MSDKSQVVTSLLQLGESIGNFALQAGEVTKEMERAKKRCRLTTNFLKEHNEGREMLHKNVSSFRFHFLLKTLRYMGSPRARGQDGWILAKFFFGVFLDRDGFEFYKFAKNERDKNIQQT